MTEAEHGLYCNIVTVPQHGAGWAGRRAGRRRARRARSARRRWALGWRWALGTRWVELRRAHGARRLSAGRAGSVGRAAMGAAWVHLGMQAGLWAVHLVHSACF